MSLISAEAFQHAISIELVGRGEYKKIWAYSRTVDVNLYPAQARLCLMDEAISPGLPCNTGASSGFGLNETVGSV